MQLRPYALLDVQRATVLPSFTVRGPEMTEYANLPMSSGTWAISKPTHATRITPRPEKVEEVSVEEQIAALHALLATKEGRAGT